MNMENIAHSTLVYKSMRIGTAGWTIPTYLKNDFALEGSHLERYSQVFNSVEINSSFYRDHKSETYAKWNLLTPKNFRFSVKLSRYFTQEKRLEEAGIRLQQTLEGISHLKEKWGVLLIQLPPRLAFSYDVVKRFIDELRHFYTGPAVWEPRHPSWACLEAIDLFNRYEMSKVFADPEPCPLPEELLLASSTKALRYFRLHGSPEIYKSHYTEETMISIVHEIQKSPLFNSSQAVPSNTWVIFDNTTYGYATQNALELQQLSIL